MRVLIAPLNWGLGHATRCVPIIREFISQGINPIIGADGNALAFLEKEFPNLEHICIPDLNIKYSTKYGAYWSVLLNLKTISNQIRKEHLFLKKLFLKTHFDIIVSDNRYGLHHKKSYNVFVSHQHNIFQKKSLKTLSFIPKRLISNWLCNFNICLIPDYKECPTLAGKLCHPSNHNNTRYVGPLSRFLTNELNFSAYNEPIPVLFSGPDPMRSQLLSKTLSQLEKTSFKYVIYGGNPKIFNTFSEKNFTFKSHDDTISIEKILNAAPLVITSGGYSSLMDMYVLNKKAIFIPFFGQTEQEYLASFHCASPNFRFVNSRNLCKIESVITDLLSINNDVLRIVPKSTLNHTILEIINLSQT